MAPRLYLYAAIVVAVLVGVGAIYAKGQLDARHAKEIESLRADLRVAELVLEREREARRQDAILAAENARRKAALEARIRELDDYVDNLEDRDRECLSGADADRLRHLWED